ncbi:MAG: GntR family transcriptional regulator [Methylobacteriaceae bacterium]|nr:GntR family transcriptional regulator [Methylobacteriaceae bacterium]
MIQAAPQLATSEATPDPGGEPSASGDTLRLDAPIARQIIARLRQAIIETRIRPGQALSEAEIAARYGVSRQPVREAFIGLRNMGLVQILPSRGTKVVKISGRAALNARFVREAIECAVARAAARLVDEAGRDELERSLAAQAQAAATGDATRFYELDESFHRAIAAIADCDYAARIVESVRVQLDRVRFLSLPEATPLATLVAQHRAIATAIQRGDDDAAERAMRAHLREVLTSLPRLASLHPELFEDVDLPRHVATQRVEPDERA